MRGIVQAAPRPAFLTSLRPLTLHGSRSTRIGPFEAGPGQPLLIIAGPCVLEDGPTNERIGAVLAQACGRLGLSYVFKASFDKANRSSILSPRGPGLERGLEELARLGRLLGAPVLTDIHEAAQAALAAQVVSCLQIPAFLCRQTDLLMAAARTGRAVNVKKGQFMAPAEMGHVVAKLRESGCGEVMVTERGTFFGYHRLVNDFIGVGDLMELEAPSGPAVCFDVTHSTQLPGAAATGTAGRPERAALLARAAVAAGVDALFLECHPDPPRAFSDAATALPLPVAVELLEAAAVLHRAVAGLSREGVTSRGWV
jgi:2-dehydro-3-deoxyphosphooctonate aldolase (KDO 8-P synthase)